VGPSDLTHTIIEAGLQEGDIVITGPYKALEGMANDATVRLQPGSTTQPAATQTASTHPG